MYCTNTSSITSEDWVFLVVDIHSGLLQVLREKVSVTYTRGIKTQSLKGILTPTSLIFISQGSKNLGHPEFLLFIG